MLTGILIWGILESSKKVCPTKHRYNALWGSACEISFEILLVMTSTQTRISYNKQKVAYWTEVSQVKK